MFQTISATLHFVQCFWWVQIMYCTAHCPIYYIYIKPGYLKPISNFIPILNYIYCNNFNIFINFYTFQQKPHGQRIPSPGNCTRYTQYCTVLYWYLQRYPIQLVLQTEGCSTLRNTQTVIQWHKYLWVLIEENWMKRIVCKCNNWCQTQRCLSYRAY